MDWVITIPMRIKWGDYMREVEYARRKGQHIYYKLPFKPIALCPGDRIFVTYTGRIRGYMYTFGVQHMNAFTCEVTGKYWTAGWYLSRGGKFFARLNGKPMKGFRGIRHYNDEGLTDGQVKAINKHINTNAQKATYGHFKIQSNQKTKSNTRGKTNKQKVTR